MDNETSLEQSERPEWWQKNQQLREAMELPPYRPPRFNDGVITREVVMSLEDKHDCSIAFRSKNPQNTCEWQINVDGECIGTTERQRSDRGNTVYQLSAEAFVELVDSVFE